VIVIASSQRRFVLVVLMVLIPRKAAVHGAGRPEGGEGKGYSASSGHTARICSSLKKKGSNDAGM
jgi:hypothetical protein